MGLRVSNQFKLEGEWHWVTGNSGISVFTFERCINEDEGEGLVRRKGKNGVAVEVEDEDRDPEEEKLRKREFWHLGLKFSRA
jgi:hypothetical protein